MSIVLVCICVAVAAPGPGPEAKELPLTKPVKVEMIAVQATQELPPLPPDATPEEKAKKPKKRFEKGLERIKPAVDDLKFDTFKKVAIAKATAPPGREAKLPINAKYTLFVTPISKDAKARIRIKARVEEKVPKKLKNGTLSKKEFDKRQALSVMSSVAPGKPLRLGGFKLKK
ncbi:MAG: hypothetical protein GY851_17530, partial [bacterium]|nr:hypothetical protein [bacterium]